MSSKSFSTSESDRLGELGRSLCRNTSAREIEREQSKHQIRKKTERIAKNVLDILSILRDRR